MQRRTQDFLAAALVLSVLMTLAFSAGSSASAETPLDYPINNGHFFTQAVSDSGSVGGYSVTNGEEIPFWDAFQEYGGVSNLGYPCSRRFLWQGYVCQVTENAILKWNAETREVQLVNFLDELSRAGKDEWLEKGELIPKPVIGLGERFGTWDEAVNAHRALLDDAPVTRSYYYALPERAILLGLPKSRAEDLGSCYSVRFQRGALYVWKESVNGVSRGQITVASVGEVARESGLFDESVFRPEVSPASLDAAPPDLRSGSNRGTAVRGTSVRASLPLVYGTSAWHGTATWYGAYFQGSPMRNGDPYNMYDPTTTASNVYPLGSLLLVTNTWSGNSIKVRVTDTGAFRYPIIVDLSYAAFCQLANPSQGVIGVVVERLE